MAKASKSLGHSARNSISPNTYIESDKKTTKYFIQQPLLIRAESTLLAIE